MSAQEHQMTALGDTVVIFFMLACKVTNSYCTLSEHKYTMEAKHNKNDTKPALYFITKGLSAKTKTSFCNASSGNKM